MDYSPTDAWPDHPNACWRATLDYARTRSWSLRRFAGHTWGEIRCPDRSCSIKVFSTGRGQESVAKGTRRHVERCPHQPGLADLLDVIEDRLTKASRLVDAAESLAARDESARMAELLDESDSLMGGDAAWDEFGQLVDEGARHTDAAAVAFADAGEPVMKREAALDLADSRVREIRGNLKVRSPGVARVKELKGVADALRDRIVAVRRR